VPTKAKFQGIKKFLGLKKLKGLNCEELKKSFQLFQKVSNCFKKVLKSFKLKGSKKPLGTHSACIRT
jgi:hypothetical protein